MTPVTKTPFTWENVRCPVAIIAFALAAALIVIFAFVVGVI